MAVSALTALIMAAGMLMLGAVSPAAAVTVEDIEPKRVLAGPQTGFEVAGALGLAQDTDGNLYVGTNATNERDAYGRVRTFTPTASGDTPEFRSFGPAVQWPSYLTLDSKNYIYAGTGDTAEIKVYRPGENKTFSQLRPERTITGRYAEWMGDIRYVGVDAQGYIYASWGLTGVRIYAPGANGAAVPDRVILDDGTGSTKSISGLFVEPDGTLYVRTPNKISVYAPGAGVPCPEPYIPGDRSTWCTAAAGGGVKPTRVITGPNTYMSQNFIGPYGPLTVDSAGNIYVAGGYPPTTFQNVNLPQRILVFPPGANGNVSPSRIIGGPNTGMLEVRDVIINGDGEIVVSDRRSKSVRTFGAVAPQPPDPPVNIDASPRQGAAVVSFTPGGSGTQPIAKYYYSINRGISWVEIGLPAGNAFEIPGLTDGTTYEVYMQAESSVGKSDQSTPVKVTPGAPAAPTNLVATPGIASAQISFTPPPTAEGQAPVANYEYRISEYGDWLPLVPPATGSPVTIPALTLAAGGPEFNIALRAVNSVGVGDASEEVTVVVQDAPPAPQNLEATHGDGSAELTFIPPLVDPSVPLLKYQYTVDDGATWIDAPLELPLKVTGLTNGVRYPVQVRGVNSLGNGLPSQIVEVEPFSLVTVPEAPEIVNADGANESITVNFVEPFDGGAPITNYEYSVDDGATWQASFPPVNVSPVVINGLTNGQTYAVRVRALNEVGASAASNAVQVTVPIPTTVAYTGVGTVPIGESVMLRALVFDKTANPPTLLSGREVTFTFGGKTYTATTDAQGVAEVASDPVTEAIGESLQVRAEVAATADATGDETTSTIEVVSAGAPAVTTDPATDVTSTTATLKGKVTAKGQNTSVVFRYSSDPDFADALEIEAVPSPVAGLVETSVTAALTRLVPGQNYFVKLVATNADGTAEGAVEEFTAAAAAPEVVTLPASPVGANEAQLNATVNPRGADTTALSLKYSTDESEVESGGGNAVPIDPTKAEGIIPLNVFGGASGLRAATKYFYRVSATNSVGESSGDVLEFTTEVGVPEAPVDAQALPSYSSAQIVFTPGYDGGSAITGYEYSLDDGATWQAASSLTSPITIEGLDNGVTYPVKLRAVNEIGPGAETPTMFVTPLGATFVPLDPVRAYDSRNDFGTGEKGPLAAGSSRIVDVGASAGVPQDAVAVAYNLTVVGMEGAGYLTVAPGDTETLPLASTINYSGSGQMWANGYITGVDEGRLEVFAQGSSTQFIVDVVGYYLPKREVKSAAVAEQESLFVPMTPVRAYDSRDIGAGGPLSNGQQRTVNITAGGEVPREATAVAYTLTETGTNGRGYLAVGPAGEPEPTVSSINWFTDNQTTANSSVVAVNDGKVTVYAGSSTPGGNSQFVIDILGFYVPADSADWSWAGRYTEVDPQRQYDSRFDDPTGPIGGGEAFVTGMDVPPSAVAVVFNLTETGTSGSGYLTSTPGDTKSPPVASTINWWTSNQTIANGTVVGLSGEAPTRFLENPRIKTYAGGGSSQYVLDLGGYFHFSFS